MAEAKAGNVAGVHAPMNRALEMIDFHHGDPEFARGMIETWQRWEPRSPDLVKWKRKFGL
jgi:hypothetical protein